MDQRTEKFINDFQLSGVHDCGGVILHFVDDDAIYETYICMLCGEIHVADYRKFNWQMLNQGKEM